MTKCITTYCGGEIALKAYEVYAEEINNGNMNIKEAKKMLDLNPEFKKWYEEKYRSI